MTPSTSCSFSRETSVLWAGETCVCFILSYVVLYKVLNQLNFAALNYAAVYAFAFGATALSVGIYRTDVRQQWRQLFNRTIVAAILSLPIIGCLLYVMPIAPFRWPPSATTYDLLAWTLLVFATRVAFGLALQSNLFSRQVIVLGASPATDLIRGESAMQGARGALSPSQGFPDDTSWSRRVWAVVVDAEAARSLPPEVRATCRQRGIKVVQDSVFLESSLHRLDLDIATPEQFAAPTSPAGVLALGMRLFDIAFALGMLIAVLPVMLMIAAAIKLEDGGPVFYPQSRVGLHGREFTLFKFRSMRCDAEALGPVWARQSDDRITRIGAIIRRLRMDELPQLFNILGGAMSVIGPRPERPHFVRQLIGAIPCYNERALVKPGLTGWAQVNYPYGASIEDARAKLSYDLYYVRHRSLWLNMLTLFATVRVVLFQEGSR